MVNVFSLDHVDNVPVVEPNQHDDVHVVLETVLVDEDEDPKENEFKEEEDPQEKEDGMEVDNEEDRNELELTYPYEEVDPLNPLPPTSESEPEDAIKVKNPIKHKDETVPASVYEEGKSYTAPFLYEDSDGLFPGLMRRYINSLFGRMASLSRRLCGHEKAYALVEKKGKAKDKYYGKLILDLGNEVHSSVEQGTAVMEKLVEKLGNAEDKVECKKLKKELKKQGLATHFFENVDAVIVAERARQENVRNDASGSRPVRGQDVAPVVCEFTFAGFMKCYPTAFHGKKRKWENFQSGNSRGKGNHRDNSRQTLQNNQKQGNAQAMVTAPTNERVSSGSLYLCERCFTRHVGPCMIKCHKCKKVRHTLTYCKEKNVTTGANALSIPTCHDCGASYEVELADGRIVSMNTVLKGCTLNLVNHIFKINLMPIELGTFDVIIGMDWLVKHDVVIICGEKVVRIPYRNKMLIVEGDKGVSRLKVISCIKARKYVERGCHLFLAHVMENKSKEKRIEDVPIIHDFTKAAPVAHAPYRLAPPKMRELSVQLQELLENGFIHPSSSPWGAPVLFMKKKDGSFRICIDYNELNKLTVKNHYPLSRIEDYLTSCKDEKEHGKHLKIILELLKKERLYAKFSKCDFWLDLIQFFGHVIDRSGVHVDPANIKSIKSWTALTMSTKYHLEKANVVADALSRKEMDKPLRVRALMMTIHNDLPNQIRKAQKEAMKRENVKAEHQKPSGLLQQPKIHVYKWDRIAMDFVSGLSRTPNGWDRHFPLVEFSYNNSYHASIKAASYEALYERKCKSPICWNEVEDSQLTGPELIHDTTEKIFQIKNHLLTARSRQKSYVDKRAKLLELEVGDMVLLKVSPWKGAVRFGKHRKLSPCYIGRFKILAIVAKSDIVVQVDEIQLDDKLHMIEETRRSTKIRAFMTIVEDELSVGKADARSGQWVDITMKKMVHVSHIIEIVIMRTGFSCNLGSRRVIAFNMTGPMCHPVDICVHFGGKLMRRRLGFDYLGGDKIMICESDLEWKYHQCEIGDVLDMYLLYDDGDGDDDDEG
nr:putative reverse transcriptase domain-containing protein [Tanacetum cinerariifolium]